MSEKTGPTFPVEQLELHLDASNLSGHARVKGVVHDLVALGPHVPSHVKRLLYERNRPATAGILLVQGVNITLLGVRPFESDPSEKKLVPPDAVLLADSMLSVPLVEALEFGQVAIPKSAPLS